MFHVKRLAITFALALLAGIGQARAANVAQLTPCSLADPGYANISPQVCQLPPNGDATQTTSDFTSTPQSFASNITRPGVVRLKCAADNSSNCAFNCSTIPVKAAVSTNMSIGVGQVEYFNVTPDQASIGWNCSVTVTTH